MSEIIKNEIESNNFIKLIGKKYTNIPNIPLLWQECFQKDFFKFTNEIDNTKKDESYVGLMRWIKGKENEFEYWIGALVTEDVNDVLGYDSLILPSDKLMTYYIKGIDGKELYDKEGDCFKDLFSKKIELFKDEQEYNYTFERYNCPRFTNPDENNEVILDFCFIIK